MSNKVNGLWAVNSSSVFMFFDSVNTPSVWRFEMKDDVESWRMIPGVKNAQAVRGVAAAYRADGGTWLDPNGSDYAQADAEAYRDAVLRADGRFLTRCTVGSGEAVRVAMVNRLKLAGVGCRSRLMRTSLKRLVELTDEFCC